MQKNISSIPGATLFRSVTSIIIILVCIVIFIQYTQGLTDKAEDIARERVVNQIKYSLSMMLYDYSIKGKQSELKQFEHENPFIALAIYGTLPRNYHGALPELPASPDVGWYFFKKSSKTVFVDRTGKQYSFIVKYSYSQKDVLGQLLLYQL